MAGGATGKASKGNRKKRQKKRSKARTRPVKCEMNADKRLSEVVPLLVSTASAVHSFLLRNDLQLLPSQFISLETLPSSTAASLSCLAPIIPISVPSAPSVRENPKRDWFDRFVSSSPDYDPRWVHFFNLSKVSFDLLLRLLAPSLTSSLHPLPPNVALAATLFRLSHGAPFSAVSRRFSIDSSTACRAFYSVCKTIVENLGHLFEFTSEINRIVVGFGWISLPNCCGALGIERFELESHSTGGVGSLLVQALVDSEGRFLDISAGWPGSQKPEDILKRSKLFSGVEYSKEYLNGPPFELNDGNSIPQYVLGSSCYPLSPWLLTPFNKNNELTPSEKMFNEAHSRGMKLVGDAFGSVKKRWKFVGNKWKEQCIEAFPFVIAACCLLHNFAIKCSDTMQEENTESSTEPEFPPHVGIDDDAGKRYRDALALHLSR